jgi:hypothetical protein
MRRKDHDDYVENVVMLSRLMGAKLWIVTNFAEVGIISYLFCADDAVLRAKRA